jgi:hypothetical protein
MSDITPDDKAALAALLRDAITTDRFPQSPSIRGRRAILELVRLERLGAQTRAVSTADTAGTAGHAACEEARR